MKLWIDDVRTPPEDSGYYWCRSVDAAKSCILMAMKTENICGFISAASGRGDGTLPKRRVITLIDIDHDAGDYAVDGGDYIKLLDWLEEYEISYPIHIHSMNPVGVANMRAIIQKNGWKEV